MQITSTLFHICDEDDTKLYLHKKIVARSVPGGHDSL